MEHTINGIRFALTGSSITIPSGNIAHGATLLDPAPWRAFRDLAGVDVPGLGVVLSVGVKRVDPVPAGAVLNLITAS